VWLPSAGVEIVIVDMALEPALRSNRFGTRGVPGPRSMLPSKNSTWPVGVAPLPLVLVTVAVKVTDCPTVDGLALDPTVVVVEARLLSA
jgi:hypothetical protein